MRIEWISSESEARLAFRLAHRVFSIAAHQSGYQRYKNALWREDPSWSFRHLLVARENNGKIVGLIRVVERTIHRANQTYRAAGITSVCVDPAYRGRGISKRLLQHALRELENQRYDIALLFASRKADYFYLQFGFWGASSYNRATLPLIQPNPHLKTLQLGSLKTSQIARYHEIFVGSYRKTFGWTHRTPAYWAYLFHKIRQTPSLRFISLLRNKRVLGYFIFDGQDIRECALSSTVTADEFISLLRRILPPNSVTATLHLPEGHALYQTLKGRDISVTRRECSYGGHMVRILKMDHCLNKLAARISRRLHQQNSRPYRRAEGPLLVVWNGRRAVVTLSKKYRRRAPPFALTAQILGFPQLSGPSLLEDAELPFNVSLLDEF